MEWDQERELLLPGPPAQAEADLLELGRRVAQELHYTNPPVHELDCV